MKFNASHGLYRKHRELNKLFARNINATFEANLTPKNKCRHISYRNKAKMFRLVRIQVN